FCCEPRARAGPLWWQARERVTGGTVIGQAMTPRLIVTLAALAGALLSSAPGPANEPIRLTQNIAGDSKPIILYADEITTWTEGNQRIFLLKGKVLVEHGIVQAHMQASVARVDQERARRTGILELELYGEGEVKLEKGSSTQTGPKALINLSTRGELKV